jgi:selenocysteine-specific elongation factor
VRPTTILDCALEVREARHGERVQVHHGARDVPGRLALLAEDGGLWQLRLEAPLLACDGDRLVIRRLAPPDTLGGGVILDAHAGRHGARPEILDRLRALARGEAAPAVADHCPSDLAMRGEMDSGPPAEALAALEERLRDAGPALLSEAQMAGEEDALRALRADGRAVRVSGRLYAHAEVAAGVRERVVALLERDGSATLAQVRDALGLSRKTAQAFLEHLDAERVTRRLPDDRRELMARHVPARAEAHA